MQSLEMIQEGEEVLRLKLGQAGGVDGEAWATTRSPAPFSAGAGGGAAGLGEESVLLTFPQDGSAGCQRRAGVWETRGNFPVECILGGGGLGVAPGSLSRAELGTTAP